MDSDMNDQNTDGNYTGPDGWNKNETFYGRDLLDSLTIADEIAYELAEHIAGLDCSGRFCKLRNDDYGYCDTHRILERHHSTMMPHDEMKKATMKQALKDLNDGDTVPGEVVLSELAKTVEIAKLRQKLAEQCSCSATLGPDEGFFSVHGKAYHFKGEWEQVL